MSAMNGLVVVRPVLSGDAELGAVAADPSNGSISLYLDQVANAPKVRDKYSTGTLKEATIPRR